MAGLMRPGTRVHVDGQPGSVAFARMAPPDYNTPEAYSVVLDSKNGQPGYTGSMFAADKVLAVTTDTSLVDCAAAADHYRKNKWPQGC